MTKHSGRRAAGVALVVVGAVWAAAAGQAWSVDQPARSVNDGVYTAAQALRGGQTFDKNCTMCHDTGRFTGADFISVWAGKPLQELYDTASKTMPEDNPGSLDPQEYGDVIAYFLELNEYPAGTEELKGAAGAMAGIKMEPRK